MTAAQSPLAGVLGDLVGLDNLGNEELLVLLAKLIMVSDHEFQHLSMRSSRVF